MTQPKAVEHVQDKLNEISQLMEEAIRGTDLTNSEAQRLSEQARMRLREAGMLLNLATGQSEPIHYTLGALMRAVMTADEQAKRIMNADIDITGKSEHEYAEMMSMFELANAGYRQWRCLSSLAMMYLSQALITIQQVNK
jgi:hypothetical protein